MSDEPKDAARIAGEIFAFVFILNVQAWLVSLCVSFVAPMVFLPFWQWLVIVFTFRFLLPIK